MGGWRVICWALLLAAPVLAVPGQMLLFQPLLSALWAALLLGESIAPRAWVAAFLVLAGVALSRWSQVHLRLP